MATENPGWTQAEFIAYLRTTLIPDLKESGREFTAQDFETAVAFMESGPELLGALKRMVDCVDDLGSPERNSAEQYARAVIAKAEGAAK